MKRDHNYEQRQAQLLTGYGAIHLHRVGDYVIVSVEARPGEWVEVIRELVDSNFSHIVEPLGIEDVFRSHGIDPSKPVGRTPRWRKNAFLKRAAPVKGNA